MRLILILFLTILLSSATAIGMLTPEERDEIEKTKKEAIELFNTGDYEKALPLIDKVLELDPEDKTALRYKLIFHRQVVEPYCKEAADSFFAGNYPDAIAAWEKILQINPKDRRVSSLIDETITVTNDDTIKTLYSNINRLLTGGQIDLALSEIEKILRINPGDERAQEMLLSTRRLVSSNTVRSHYEKAYVHMQQDEYDEAIEEWKKVLEIDPTQEKAARLIASTQEKKHEDFYAHVNSLLKMGNYGEATEELEKMLVISPNESRAVEMLESIKQAVVDNTIKEHYERAEKFAEEKKYDLAIEEWNKVLEIDPNQDMASRMIASIHRSKLDEMYSSAEELYVKGDYIKSRDIYNRILAENPTDQKTKNMVLRMNEIIKVVPQLLDKGKAWDVLRRGLVHHISSEGNPEVTVASAWLAVQLEPESTLALAIRDFIESRHISIIRTMEPPVKDMNMIEQYLFASLNHIYEGRYDLSIQECSIVLELEPENVLALKRLGSAYFAMGRKSKAREAWEKALKLAPKDSELKEFIRQTL